MRPSRNALAEIVSQCGVRLDSAQLDLLWAYHGMLRAANAELNLTRIHNFENMVLKHYVDSLLVLNYEELPSPLVDMGSGPGLPGIPLKIARPEIEMILAEPRHARAEFLERVIASLGLKGIEVHAGKVGARFPRVVQGVITRAVATIPETLERVASVIAPGGRMLLMKGPDCDDEIAAARDPRFATFRLMADHRYAIPGTPHARRLVVYERTEQPADSAPAVPAHPGPIREVSSEANPALKLMRELLHGRGVRKHGKALLAGPKVVAEVLRLFPERVEAWVTASDGPAPPEASITWMRLTKPLFQEVDSAGSHAPLLLVRAPELPVFAPDAPWPPGCTLFVPFQDPENVGAVIRTAAAFGVARVVLLREAAHPFHPRSTRAAGPALFQVALERGPSLSELDSGATPLVTLSAEGAELASSPFPERFGLVPGIEGPGLPEHLRRAAARRIPIAENVESLNAATAVAIALYEWKRS